MNKKGFTLIELIVVFVIIGIMAVIAVPNISGWMPGYRLRSATRDIVSTMRTAQMRAISNPGWQYLVNFNVGANSYILQHNTGGLGVFNDGPVQTAPSGITINIAGLPGGTATFNSNSTSSGGGVRLQNTKGATRNITVNTATGRVMIQ